MNTALNIGRNLPAAVRAALVMAVFACCVAGSAWAAKPAGPSPAQAAVAASDRSAEDRARDDLRKPVQLIEFAVIEPGMQVLEIGAGGGYTTELLARAVGPKGHVIAQNSPFVIEKFVKGAMDERLKKPAMAPVQHWVAEFSEPVPPGTKDLDAALAVLAYHDLAFFPVDRVAMNRKIFDALKPGGIYVIVDHSAKAGAPVEDAKKTHRIDEAVVRSEAEAAGFKYVDSADFLRNPKDSRERYFREMDTPTDRFVIKLIKPASLG